MVLVQEFSVNLIHAYKQFVFVKLIQLWKIEKLCKVVHWIVHRVELTLYEEPRNFRRLLKNDLIHIEGSKLIWLVSNNHIHLFLADA